MTVQPGPQLHTGRIKNVQHSYAFLTGDADHIDRFFHRTDLVDVVGMPLDDLTHVLFPGLAVSFIPVLHTVKGPRALQVRLLPSTLVAPPYVPNTPTITDRPDPAPVDLSTQTVLTGPVDG